jgi:GNAT superfamily N-acetyltransferase
VTTTAEALEIRPIVAEDRQALLEGFDRLSPESRYRRFLSPHGKLTTRELDYLTEVDHHDHEALVALDPRTGEGVGVARFVRSQTDPGEAELAVAVIDDWQRQGVGTRLVTALAERAREEGVTSFTALVLADNELMLNLLEEIGDVTVGDSEAGAVQLSVELPETGLGRLSRLLRAVARGDLRPFRAWISAFPNPDRAVSLDENDAARP